MYFADSIATETYRTFDTYIFVALFYLVLTLPLSYGVFVCGNADCSANIKKQL
jgi:putative glutamine transport system permease protein